MNVIPQRCIPFTILARIGGPMPGSGLALAASALLIIIVAACSGAAAFQGTTLDPGPAPPFRLQDQYGESVALSDMSGKVVALAFLYTHCPDVCPIVTETLRRAYILLGDDASRVEFVAISVDPDGDSVDRAYAYSQERDMLDKWRYLVGTEEELKPIWKAYWLDPVQDSSTRQQDAHGGGPASPPDNDTGQGGATAPAENSYLVTHTAPVFLIDGDGKRRALFTSLSLEPDAIVHDIRLLLARE